MTDEADSSVVLAELQVALFRECNNQRLSPWGRPFSKSTITVWLALVTNTWPLTQRVLPPWPVTPPTFYTELCPFEIFPMRIVSVV